MTLLFGGGQELKVAIRAVSVVGLAPQIIVGGSAGAALKMQPPQALEVAAPAELAGR